MSRSCFSMSELETSESVDAHSSCEFGSFSEKLLQAFQVVAKCDAMTSHSPEPDSDDNLTLWNSSKDEVTVVEKVEDETANSGVVDEELSQSTPGIISHDDNGETHPTANVSKSELLDSGTNNCESDVETVAKDAGDNKTEKLSPEMKSGENTSLALSENPINTLPLMDDNRECFDGDTIRPTLLSFKTPLTTHSHWVLPTRKVLRWNDQLILSPSEVLSPLRKFSPKSNKLTDMSMSPSQNESYHTTGESRGLCETSNSDIQKEEKQDNTDSEENSTLFSFQESPYMEENDTFGTLRSFASPGVTPFPGSQFLCKAPRRRPSSAGLSSGCNDDNWFGALIFTTPPQRITDNPSKQAIQSISNEEYEDWSYFSSQFDKAFIEEDEYDNDPVQAAFSELNQIIADMPTANDKNQLAAPLPTGFKAAQLRKFSKHQLFGLHWALWREQRFPGGGIWVEDENLNKAAIFVGLILKSKESFHEGTKEESSFIGDGSITTNSTLLICPKHCLTQWERDIRSLSGKKLRLYIHHGSKRTINPQRFISYDVVLTTFSTITAENPKEGRKCLHPSPLNQVNWNRIILDNAEFIRNSKTVFSQVILKNLKGKHRWGILMEHPGENMPQDLCSIVKFLQLTPFDDDSVWEDLFGKKKIKTGDSLRLEHLAIIRRCLTLPQN